MGAVRVARIVLSVAFAPPQQRGGIEMFEGVQPATRSSRHDAGPRARVDNHCRPDDTQLQPALLLDDFELRACIDVEPAAQGRG